MADDGGSAEAEAGTPERWLSVAEVCQRLGVQPATVYAYASRGQLRRRPGGQGRRSEYDPADVERLLRKGRRAADAPDLVLKTALTDITPAGPRYRGRDAAELAREHHFEAVAELLWTGRLGAGPTWAPDPQMLGLCRTARRGLPPAAGSLDALRAMVAVAPLADPFRHQLEEAAVVAAGRRLLGTVVAALALPEEDGARSRPGRPRAAEGPAPSIAARLCRGAGQPANGLVRLVDAALVLVADHGLAASTLAVRVAASARTDPYGAVLAGLAVLSGTRHGGATRLAEEAFATGLAAADPVAQTVRHLERDDGVVGFGLAPYADGDPRAALLLVLLEQAASRGEVPAARWRVLEAVVAAADRRGLPPPDVDLALAALTAAHDLPVGTAEAIFAVGRMAGWVAHAAEQYADPALLRPRGVYVGPPSAGGQG